MKWLAQSTIYRDGIDLVAVIDHGNGDRDVAQRTDFTFTQLGRDRTIAEPTLSLPPDAARSLLQALWDAGIRPTDWSSPDGEINALRDHVSFAQHVAKTLLPPRSTTT